MTTTEHVTASPLMILRCRSCVSEKRKDKLGIAVCELGVLVWCETCSQEVARLSLEAIREQIEQIKAGQCLCDMCQKKPEPIQ